MHSRAEDPTAAATVYSDGIVCSEGILFVLRRLRSLLGGRGEPAREGPANLYGLDPSEREKIGTHEDPLLGFEAAVERHTEAARAEERGDPERAIRLYEESVAEGFVGSYPYERLASLYERRRAYTEALRVSEAFLHLAASGRLPRGAQRSADRKRPAFEGRAERYRRLLSGE